MRLPKTTYRGMEQLVARRAHNPKVGGSSPPPATKSITVVDTKSATVIFCLYAFWADFGVKSGVFRLISALCQG